MLDKQPGIFLFRVKETCRHLFAKCVLKFTGPKATNSYQDDQLCTILNAAIDGVVHKVQYIWDSTLSEKDWVFILVDEKTLSTRSIALE